MASFRERAEADLLGKTAKQLQNSSDTQSTKTTFRERAEADLTKNSHEANAAYKAQKQAREQAQLAEQQQKRQQEQQEKREQLLKAGRQTTRKRINTGANESKIGEGWQGRTNLDKMWGEELSTTAYQNSVDAALATLDNTTPDTTNMNDATRYEQMQEARRRANNLESIDAGKQEAFDAAKWEETQRIGIQGTKDNQLLQNLQQLNELYTTANLGHESVAQTAKEQYDALYSQLKSQYGEQVDDWAEYVKRLDNAESMREMTQRIANAADESPVVASAVTPIVNVASGAGIVDVAAQKLRKAISGSDTPIDYNRAAQLPSNWVTTTRGTVSENIAEATDGWIGSDAPIGNLYSGLYNIGMSMADSVVGQKLGGATIFLGGAAATSAMNEARKRGASTDQALAMGLLAGTAETIMEKIPMEKLLSQTNPTSVRSAIKNIVSQGASESTEEGLTTLANTISDAIIMGDKSELNTAIRRYRANGYSDDEAQKKAFTDWLIGLAGDAIGGAVSGGLFAAAYNVPGGIDYRRSGGGTTNNQTNSNANANANASSNANTGVDQSVGKGSNTEQTADPLEFAIQETMQPSQERQAFDQAMEDTANWMLGKEKTATADAETGSTKVNTDPAKHTPVEQAVIEEYQAAVDPNLVDYYNEVDNGNTKGFYPLKPVNERAAADIQAITGNDVTGYQTRFDARQMYHVKDDHGPNGKSNRSMSDSNDVGRVQYVLDNYDSVEHGGTTDAYWETKPNGHNRRAQTVLFKKKVNGTYYVVEAAPVTKAKSLYVVSAYMDGTKKAEAIPHLLDAEASQPRPKTSNAYHASDDFTILHSNQNVNQNQQTSSDNDMGHGAVGAAEIGFNAYSNYQNQTDAADFMPEGANAARPVDMPKVDPTGKQVRSGAKTIYGAEATTGARATQMESEYMEGLYGYDPVRDKPTLEKAKTNLQEEGYDRAYARVAEKLAQVKDMKQTAMEAFLLYSDAVQSGRDADAANLCLLLVESGTEFGQGAQVFAMFRKLSPEGQLYALQKSVERLNARMNPETSQDITIKQEALRDITKTRDAALQMLEQLNSRDHGVPVEDWMQEVGKQLAKAVGEMPTPPKPKTVAQTIRGDLLRFAKQYLPKKAKGNKRTGIDMLRDFYGNKELYYEAWDAAREAYAKKNGPSSAFAEASMTGVPENSVMLQAIIDEIAGQELKKRNINIRTQLGDTSGLVSEISDSIISKTGATGIDAREIRGSVQQYFDEVQHDVEHGATKSGKNKLEQTNTSIQSDIAKVVKEMGQTAAEIIRSSDQTKTKTARLVANELVSQYGISKKNAKTAANMIVERFNQYVAEKSESTLRNMFEQREGKNRGKQTFEDRFDELANLGAFTNENWASTVNEKMFGPGVTLDPSLVQRYVDAPNQQVRDTVMDEIYQNIGKQIPTTFGEAANQWRYMSMLLNPSTHLKNMGGNLSMMMLKGSKDVVGAGIEVVSNKVSGGKVGRTKSVLNPLSAKDRSLMNTAWADFDNVRDDVAGTGKNSDNLMGKVGEYRNYWKLNDPKTKVGQVVDEVLRTAEKVPQANTKLLDLEDQLFSQPDYALSLAGYMKANHQTEITAEARAYAIKEAQKATFRDANAISTFARNMGHTNSKLWNGIVNAVFPFKGTPANVGVRAVEYSPLGFVSTVAQAIQAKNNGTFKATDFIDNISANLVGSALSAFGYWLASNAWLRVSGVGDDKEKSEQKENGYLDNSFQLFGYSIPENAFTSASAPMFIGAAAYEALATKALTGETYTLDDYIEALSTTVDPLLEQTMLTGLDDVLTTARYNQGGLGDTLREMGLQVAGSWLNSYIPTLLSRISAAADGTQRQVYIDKNKPLQGVQRQVQNLMMKTPLRTMLNERVDRYGNVQTQEDIFNTGNEKLDNALNFGYNVITPSYASKIQGNPISDELSRLYRSSDVDNSERKLFQSDAPKSIQVNGVTTNLTGEQYENYEKIRGSNTTEYLGALQKDSLYDSMDDAMQGYATDKMHDYIEQTSKAELGIGYEPTDDWIADLQGKSEAEIIETVLYKTFESAVTGKEYANKYDGMADLVDDGKLSDAMAITMMPSSMQTAYQDVAKAGGVSVNEWLDMYAYAYAAGKTDSGTQDTDATRTAALKYINQQNWSESKKTAAANAVYSYLPNTVRIDVDVPYDWALDQGESGLATVVRNMSESQKENYQKYIEGHFDNDKVGLYMDAYKFKGSAKTIYKDDGETVEKSAKDQVIEYIDAMDLTDREKIRIYLGLGYSINKIPDIWDKS